MGGAGRGGAWRGGVARGGVWLWGKGGSTRPTTVPLHALFWVWPHTGRSAAGGRGGWQAAGAAASRPPGQRGSAPVPGQTATAQPCTGHQPTIACPLTRPRFARALSFESSVRRLAASTSRSACVATTPSTTALLRACAWRRPSHTVPSAHAARGRLLALLLPVCDAATTTSTASARKRSCCRQAALK